MVIPLKEIIKLEENNPNEYKFFSTQINTFVSQNNDVVSFLKEKAIDFERRNKARTFLCFDSDGMLQGYFALSVKNLEFSNNVSGTLKSRISGFGKTSDAAIVYLIGQLGRDSNRSSHGFGIDLLNLAFQYLFTAQSIIGVRYCLVETENSSENERVIDFYKNYGFSFLQNDKKDNYQQLVIKMEQN